MGMTGLDLFAGAGGMSLGASSAGIKVAFAVEADEHAADTYAQNHTGTFLFRRDIRELAKQHLENIPRGKYGTILFGGPPCQGFSYSNQRTRSSENPNNWLFLEFIRVVRLWEPDWVVFENVKGITNTEGGTFLEQVLHRLNRAKYTLSHAVLNAANFGAAQHRERFFVVGSRHGLRLSLPTGNPTIRFSVNDAIADLPTLANGASNNWMNYGADSPSVYAKRLRGRLRRSPNHLVSRNADSIVKRYPYIPQGGNWANIPARLMRNYADRSRCHTGIYHRLDAGQPSVVIGNYRKNMLIHPTQDRGLSVREAARIQSFPDWYEFVGSIGFQQQQVGNAVPPLLAEAIFRSILLTSGVVDARPEALCC